MSDILMRVETSGMLIPGEENARLFQSDSTPEVVARTAAELGDACKAAAIVCLTLTGNIARTVAKYRPQVPVVALSPRPDVVRKLSLVRGVSGLQNSMFFDTDGALHEIAKSIVQRGMAKEGDLLVITGGIPLASMQPTNLIKMHRISKEDVL
jgi:pyruvate kinase